MRGPVSIEGYFPAGDLTVISICYVMLVLMLCSYIRKSRSFRIFFSLVIFVMLAAYTNISFYALASRGDPRLNVYAHVLRCAYHVLLHSIFLHYVIYITDVTLPDPRRRRPYVAVATALFAVSVLMDIVDAVRGRDFLIVENRLVFNGRDAFFYSYLAFVALIVVLMIGVNKRLYRRVMIGFYCTMGISFAVLLLQMPRGQRSFTVATFLFPVIAMFYVMHSSPYDVRLGALDRRALEDLVRYNYARKRDFIFMSLYMKDFDEESKLLPEAIQAVVRRFSADFFRGASLFQVGSGHLLLVFPKRRNVDYDRRIDRILAAFDREYQRFQYDYKIVIGHSVAEVSRKNEYVSFIRGVHRGMPENTVHRIEPGDVKGFNHNDYILKELEDIASKRDLNDPRVRVYCQPVLNIRTGRYDTAEALMRLQLEEMGVVTPDRFISVAEENGLIHALTEIILNKTCAAIRALTEASCEFDRVSVNVSVLELKEERFCDDIARILAQSGVPGSRIAFELTESHSDSDFMLMKEKIAQLRKQGIKFYLDDFGTGYSNMERIMELPFDIIKFDRTLVTASVASERSRKFVLGLASMFAELGYAVLYEGVETETDEHMCREMAASYLQGYRYARPAPIENLKAFLDSSEKG